MNEILAYIDKQIESGASIVAIDGRCASGKSTLASLLESKYDCNVFHMDDFFLQPYQRTDERYKAPGENVDHERFLSEVLIPLKEKKDVMYRPFNCQKLEIEPGISKPYKNINIIEGSYSLHPDLISYYDSKILLLIDEDLQKERIKMRNSKEMTERFFSTWIPLEEKYLIELDIASKSDRVFTIK